MKLVSKYTKMCPKFENSTALSFISHFGRHIFILLKDIQSSKFATIQCSELTHFKPRENRIIRNIFQNVTICFL